MSEGSRRQNAELRWLEKARRISPRQWERYANWLFAAFCLVLIAGLINWGAISYSEQQNEQREQRRQTAQYEASNGAERWEAYCTDVARTRTTTCVINPPDTKGESHRAERDLRAQEQMANWALLMFFATLIGIAITMIGLIYVIRAYDINAKATDHAAAAARAANDANTQTRAQFIAQQRPWLSVRAKIESAAIVGERSTGWFSFTIFNHGPSPALDVDVKVRPPVRLFNAEQRELFAHMTQVERTRSIEPGDVAFPDLQQPLIIEKETMFEGIGDAALGIWHVTGWVRYRFQGSAGYALTPFHIVATLRGAIVSTDYAVSSVEDSTGIPPS